MFRSWAVALENGQDEFCTGWQTFPNKLWFGIDILFKEGLLSGGCIPVVSLELVHETRLGTCAAVDESNDLVVAECFMKVQNESVILQYKQIAWCCCCRSVVRRLWAVEDALKDVKGCVVGVVVQYNDERRNGVE